MRGERLLTLACHGERLGLAFSERNTGMDHVAFRVGSAGDVEARRARFEQLCIDHADVKVTDRGIARMTFRDPENIQLEVFGGPGLG